MAFKDNRDFIAALEKTGDVVRIKNEVDWNLEAGGIVRRANELMAPAPFFEKIKDYPAGYRIFGAPLATHRRMAIAMGLEPDISVRDLQLEYERRIQRPIKPMIVTKAPCKENILLGDDVDLYRFPAPMIHDGDGGRYLCTWNLDVCQDPDIEWTNWGLYRRMILNQRYLTGQCDSYSDQGRIFHEKYVPQHKNLPVAVVIGADPICIMVAGSSFRIGESEVDYAGALSQAPVELVKCETSSLLVPAHAEIVIEAEIVHDVRVDEGPFGEFTGYRTPRMLEVLFDVKAITYRNDPILTMSCMGMPVDDAGLFRGIDSAVQVKRFLKQFAISFTDVSVPAEASQHLAIIGIKKNYNYSVSRLFNAICLYGRVPTTIVVDEDVDVFNMNEVIHALVTKCHPVNGILVREGERVIPLTPYLTSKEKLASTGPKLLFDCTWPLDWPKETRVPPRMSFAEAYPEEIKQKILKNWKTYGYK
ncbi:MAG: UbiD family decarboxylase [Desulfobacterales bacterium]|nr:UbiD family decarboxylase [Desulfobacterales bacterium]